jgi:hypothetical protein
LRVLRDDEAAFVEDVDEVPGIHGEQDDIKSLLEIFL